MHTFSYLLQLKVYAYKYRHGSCNEQCTLRGYSLLWNKTIEDQFESDTKKSEYIIPLILFPIAFVVGLSGGHEVLKVIGESSSNFFANYCYLFWSFQCFAALINGLHTGYMYTHHNIMLYIAIAVPTTTFVLFSPCLVAVYYCKEVCIPFTTSSCFRFSDPISRATHDCKFVFKLVSIFIVTLFTVWNPFLLFVYMAYNLPWLILGFYVNPIKILVRISAILTAALCIIVISYLILLYLVKCLKKKPQYSPLRNEQPNGNDQLTTKRRKDCDRLFAAIKCLSGVLVLACFGFIAYLLYHIIFEAPNEEEKAVIELLHILPLAVVSMIVYVVRHLIELHKARDGNNPQSINGNNPSPIN